MPDISQYTKKMFKRKLRALEYPAVENFNVNDKTDFRNLVIWLEDQKICHYKVQDRSIIRDANSLNWNKIYQAYLKDVSCPVQGMKREEELEWLLALAVKREYSNKAQDFRTINTKNVQNNISTPKIITANSMDNLDFQSPDFIKGVKTLASLLKIPEHPDHLVTLKAITKLVASRLHKEALTKPNSFIVKGTPFPFQDADSGFDMSDNALNEAAKILRLLYIHDLRGLQTQINECIAAVQTFTANPKTDTKLGQVGR